MKNWKNKYDSVGKSSSDGMIWVILNNKYGFVNEVGKVMVPPIYDMVGKFYEGRVWVELNNKYGFVDATGKIVVPIIYDGADNFSNGRVRIGLNNQEGYVGLDGRLELRYHKPFIQAVFEPNY
jgi:hypothetical protein